MQHKTHYKTFDIQLLQLKTILSLALTKPLAKTNLIFYSL